MLISVASCASHSPGHLRSGDATSFDPGAAADGAVERLPPPVDDVHPPTTASTKPALTEPRNVRREMGDTITPCAYRCATR